MAHTSTRMRSVSTPAGRCMDAMHGPVPVLRCGCWRLAARAPPAPANKATHYYSYRRRGVARCTVQPSPALLVRLLPRAMPMRAVAAASAG
jgi:hypothetical protein